MDPNTSPSNGVQQFQDSSLEAPAAETVKTVSDYEHPRYHFLSWSHHRRRLVIVNIAVLAVITLMGVASFLLLGPNNQGPPSKSQKIANYNGTKLPVNNVKPNNLLQVGSAQQLAINGQVTVGNTLVLVPTATPSKPTAGQLYYNQQTNTPYYYNGTQFVSLAPQTNNSTATVQGGVTSLGGSSGIITLASGLALSGGQLGLRLQAGTGVIVSGNTISNSGVVSLTAGSPNLVVTNDGNGNYSISNSTSGVIGGGGTVGQLPLFTPNGQTLGDSILSQTGTSSITDAGALIVQGAASANSLAINTNKLTVDTTGNLVSAGTLSVANSNFQVDGSGNVTLQSGATVFANNLSQTASGQDVSISAGSNVITFTSNGMNFIFPTSGGVNQEICTTGISCAAGGGQAVLLAPNDGGSPAQATVQTNNTAFSSIFINNTGGANLLELQGGGTNSFVVAQSGSTTIAAGNNVGSGTSSLTLGTSSTAGKNGSLTFNNSSGTGTLTLQSGNTSGNLVFTLPTQDGSATDCLKTNGLGALSFGACSAGSGVTTVGTIDTQTPSVNGAVISGTSIYLQSASATVPGLVNTSSLGQTFAGPKTFSGSLTASAGLSASGGPITLTGNAASSFTTSSGALTLTSAGAATWSTTSGQLTVQSGGLNNLVLQAGSGTVSLGSSTALTASGALGITSGGATALSLDAGGAAALNLGTTNANAVSISKSGVTTTVNGALTVTQPGLFNGGLTVATGSTFTNASSTLLSSKAIADHPTGGPIGTAATTVDVATTFDVTQTTAGQTLTLPNPTVNTSGRIVYVNSLAGNAAFSMYGVNMAAGASASFIWNGSAWVATSTGGSGVNTVGTLDALSGVANGAQISGSTIYLQSASATVPGLVNTSSLGQTFAGPKTFSGSLTASAGLSASGGAITLQGNAASSLTTSSGALTLTSASAATWSTASGQQLTVQSGSGTLSLGSTTALTASGALGIDTGTNTTALSLGGANANAVNISRSGAITTIKGDLTIQGTNILLPTSGLPSAAGSILELNTLTGAVGTYNGGIVSGIKDGLGVSKGGTITIANTNYNGTSTLTINDASTSQKGIAQFSSTNFSASSGSINTIQDIAIASSPTFNSVYLNGGSSPTAATGIKVQGGANGISLQSDPTGTNTLLQLGTTALNSPTVATYLGINQSSTSDFLNFQASGTSVLEVTSAGAVKETGPLTVGTSSTQGQLTLISAGGSSNGITVKTPSNIATSGITLVLPSNVSPGGTSWAANYCLKLDSLAGNTATLGFENCIAGSSGGTGTLAIQNSDSLGGGTGSQQLGATFWIQGSNITKGNTIQQGPSSVGTAVNLLQFVDNVGTTNGGKSGGVCPSGAALQLNYSTGCSSAINIGTASGVAAGVNFGGDTLLYRSATNTLTLGVPATNTTMTLQSASGTLLGNNLVLAAGGGIGSSTGGSISLQVAPPQYGNTNANFANLSTWSSPQLLASDSTYIYWASQVTGNNCIARGQVNATQTSVFNVASCYVNVGARTIQAITSDGSFIYYVDGTNTGERVDKAAIGSTGSTSSPSVTTNFITAATLESTCTITVNNQKLTNLDIVATTNNNFLYWTDIGSSGGSTNCIGEATIPNTGGSAGTVTSTSAFSQSGLEPTGGNATINGFGIDRTSNYMFWNYQLSSGSPVQIGMAQVNTSNGAPIGGSINANAYSYPVSSGSAVLANYLAVGGGSGTNPDGSTSLTDNIFFGIKNSVGSGLGDTISAVQLNETTNVFTTSSSNLLNSTPVLPLSNLFYLTYGNGYLYWLPTGSSAQQIIGRIAPIGNANTPQTVLTVDSAYGGTHLTNAIDNTQALLVQNASLTSNVLAVDTLNTAVVTQGSLQAAGGFSLTGLSTPSIPVVTKNGAGSGTLYNYAVSAVTANGGQTPISVQSVGVSNSSTLNSTNSNTVAWSPIAGASKYYVYRCVGASSGAGSAIGVIAVYSAASYYDSTNNNAFNSGLAANLKITDTGQGLASGFSTTSCGSPGVSQDTSASLSAAGPALFKNTTNSTTAFQVQNATGTTVFDVDTSTGSGRIGIGTITPGAKLDIQAATSVGLNVNQTGSSDILDLQNAGTTVLSVGSAGNVLVQPSSNSTQAFAIKNASPGNVSLLNADTQNMKLTVQAGTDASTVSGSNLAPTNFSTGWTGTNWTLTSTTAAHSAGAGHTQTLSPTTALATTSGKLYQITYTITNPTTSGTGLTVALDGTTIASYSFDANTAGTYSFTDTVMATAPSNNANLTFTPDGSGLFTGTISGVSVFQVTPNSNAVLTVNNSSSNAVLEVRSSATGSNNLLAGLNAGQSVSTGANNLAFGTNALQNNSTGNSNTAIGTNALQNNSTGNSNTALGSAALQKNTTGIQNLAIGSNSLTNNTIGNFNTGIGTNTLQNNTAGSSNTAVGISALLSNTTGSNNLAFGNNTLGQNTTGNNNIGISGLGANTTGSSNVGIGGLGSNNGSKNVGVGVFSLNNSTGVSNDTAIGYQTLQSDLTGSYNIGLGYGADVLSGNLQSADAIGAGAQVGSSNTTILGFSQANSTNNTVGIGTSFAPYALTVSPTTYGTNGSSCSSVTITQSASTTVTASASCFVAGMVGGTIYYSDGTNDTIASFVSGTQITTTSSHTKSGTFNIVWGGFNVTNSGAIDLASTSTTAFVLQTTTGTSFLTADTQNMKLTIGVPLTLNANLTLNGHLITGGGAIPSGNVAVSADSTIVGTVASGASCTVTGTDTAGKIVVHTGSSGSFTNAGVMCTITFANSFGVGVVPQVVLGAGDQNAAKIDPYATATDNTKFTISNSYVLAGGVGGQNYTFEYFIAQ